LLDNSQNKHFIDNYIGSNIPMDISQIYFCCTLNDQDKLSPILKNRIKIITVPGYDMHEKICIVKDHILPKIIETTIFKNYTVDFKDKEIEYLIKNKTEREEGMRNIIRVLKELIEKLQLNYLYDPSNYKGDKLYITKQTIDKIL
jgi:ATP-dependent Lon protease